MQCLFRFRSSKNSKHVIWLFIEFGIEESVRYENGCDKCKYNDQLRPGCFLNILPGSSITDLAGAVLHLSVIKKRIHFTSQTNTKRRFKEQEYQANQADNAGYRAVGINDHH